MSDHADTASPRDRAHFAAIADAEAMSEEERIDEAIRTSPGERILMGVRLGSLAPFTGAHLAEMDARADGQAELARIRVARGLGLSDEG